MQQADLRVQSTVPTNLPSSSSVVGLFANSTSGIEAVYSDGKRDWVGGRLTGSLTLHQVKISQGPTTSLSTGVFFTAFTGTASQTGLGMPSLFVPFKADDGLMYAIPAYPYR